MPLFHRRRDVKVAPRGSVYPMIEKKKVQKMQHLLRATRGAAVIAHFGAGEVNTGEGTYACNLSGDACRGNGRAQPLPQAVAELIDAADLFPGQDIERCQPCGHGDGIAAERARLAHPAALRIEVRHNVRPASERSHREATADDLSKGCEVRIDTVELLCSTVGQPESDDFIER